MMIDELKHIADKTIPPSDNRISEKYEDGNTSDIISVILDADKLATEQLKIFSKYFKSDSVLNTCSLIFSFIKQNIKYSKDPEDIQLIRLPSQFWKSKKGDCKSFALFIAGILSNLNIKYKYRFTAYRPGDVTHVYVVAYDEQGNEIIIDAVYKSFNAEKKYLYKKDIEMVKIATITGIYGNDLKEIPKITALHTALIGPFAAGRLIAIQLIKQNIAFLNQKRGIASQMYALVNAGKKYEANKVLVDNPVWANFKKIWYNVGGEYDASELAKAMFEGAGKPLFRVNLKDPGRAEIKKYGIGDGGASATLITGSVTASEVLAVLLAGIGMMTAYFNSKGDKTVQDDYLTNYYQQNANLLTDSNFATQNEPQQQIKANWLPYAAAGIVLLLLIR